MHESVTNKPPEACTLGKLLNLIIHQLFSLENEGWISAHLLGCCEY